ncbi:L-lactate dehydrogenase (cytochrome) [Fusarium oxysporum f. sp. raphani 54005]|uniref:L-lactate dehydrogenase (Cytochrome) n=3 Tax=Fusarium oxysporum TaxID=5507 RepID=X0B125_FUSOX|nr:L-lactate dehydrogenase (cytochrome) [Fusarium oxysporum f. sp. raphani 54005]EXM12571.1 L-lactate dehydrogenase (cytochrome) [Fusarium oxysporum f. sp. vasinfectum 25433]KAG7410172.1 putative lactate 2-monooxygenase [Fusarium oxysporum f. sp. raphani]
MEIAATGRRIRYQNNITSFTRWSIILSRLVPNRKDNKGSEQFSDATTRVLGQTPPSPLAIAPIGVQKIFNSEGEVAAARAAAKEWAKIMFPEHSHSWEDVEFLKTHWDGPIVLKGIQSVQDARKCVEVGVQGIVVRNHGGRQQDGGVSSLGMLPRIVDAVGDDLDIFVDSGIRCGADTIKALALGANCVLIGRPYAYGLALGGEDGVKHVLGAICGDLTMNMHLSGLRDINKVTRDILVKESDLV